MVRSSIVVGVFAAAILAVVPSKVIAQDDADNFFVDHFTAADQHYTFVNPCSFGAPGVPTINTPTCSPTDGLSYVCANFYVYSFQDIVACGSCIVSPNGSLEEDLHANLLEAPVTGVTPTTGVVKVVPTQNPSPFFNACDPTVLGANINSLSAFRFKIDDELQLDGVILSPAEKAKLEFDCSAVIDVLSGFTNVSCGPFDPKVPYKKFHRAKAH